MNQGFEASEIEKLKNECKEEGQKYILVEDEMDLAESGEYLQFQFVGQFEGKEVIYDAAMFTLELHYQSLVMEEAERRVAKDHKNFVPIEERKPGYKENPEIDELVQEYIDEIQEEDTLKVTEFVEIDKDFDFGIGLEVGLNVPEINHKVITNFIENFNNGTLSLDKNLFSFKEEE